MTLTSEEIEKSGIETSPALARRQAPEALGYALVIAHESIAQAVAEVSSAQAMARQSRAALERSRGLARTPGALPVEGQEAAARQAAVDQAALLLAERKLSASFGRNAPWQGNAASPELAALASGEAMLVRVTFPLGTVGASVPATLRLARIGEDSPLADDAISRNRFESHTVWNAPADSGIPGRSFFAVLKHSDVSEGERLIAHVTVGVAEPGLLIPYAAVLINGGKYWCYVQAKPGTFVRTEIDPSVPTEGGYFVRHGIATGASIVTSGAAQLLAKELGSAAAD